MPKQDFDLILRVQADLKAATKQLQVLNDNMRVTKSSAREGSSGVNTLGQSIKTMGRSVASTADGLGRLRNIIAGAFAVHEITRFVGSLVEANTEAQRIQFTMEQAFGKDAANQIAFIRDLAEKLGLNFKDAAEGFAQLATSAQGTAVTTADLRKVFVGMNEAATVLHSSTADVAGVFTQLAQGVSLGKLQMQDIRAIAQHLPGTMVVLQETAKRMGTTLTDALAHGGLDAAKALGVLGDVLHERFGQQAVAASHSLNAELNRLHSTLFSLQTDGSGFADSFAAAIGTLNTELNDPQLRAGLQDLISGLGTVINAAVNAAAKLGSFTRAYAEFVAKMQHGASPTDMGALQVEQQDIEAELKQRARHPALSAVNSFLAGTENNLVQNALEAGRPRIQAMSTEQLNARLTDIQGQIDALEAAPKPSPQNPQKGDNRGLFVGEGTTGAAAPQDKGAASKAAAAARQIAQQAAAAQTALTRALIAQKAQVDPAAAAWATYNLALAKANSDADALIKQYPKQAAAINATRDAQIQLAAIARDSKLDEIAKKDEAAWQSLLDSLRTPAEVNVDNALAQLTILNKRLQDGKISAPEYHDVLMKIADKNVGALPEYKGLDAAVGGIGSELAKNFQEQAELEKAYLDQRKTLREKYRSDDVAQEQLYQESLAKLDAEYAEQRNHIEQARGQLALQTTAGIFGQLAQLSSSHNSKMAAIGKAAAVAQAIINTYQSATAAYASLASIPYIGPALGAAAAAAAIAAGLANVAAIRAQPVGGYAEGGYTGRGGKYQVAGVVHKGEGVFSQRDIAALGGPSAFVALQRSLRGYADGGFVSGPSLDELAPRISATRMPQLSSASMASAGSGSQNARTVEHHYHVFDADELAEKIAATPANVKATIHIVGDNPRTIQAKWGR